jgi:hypothetical protein
MDSKFKGESKNRNGEWLDLSPNDSAAPFPVRLHKMLEEVVEKQGKEHIISWNPDGRSFTVHQPKVFAQSIMQKHFNQTKYKSFQRQLNLYEFDRLPRGKVKGVCM